MIIRFSSKVKVLPIIPVSQIRLVLTKKLPIYIFLQIQRALRSIFSSEFGSLLSLKKQVVFFQRLCIHYSFPTVNWLFFVFRKKSSKFVQLNFNLPQFDL